MASVPINKYSDVNNTDTACVCDEESGDDEPTNEFKVREAANYLYELRNFAITQEKPDLLHLITKSQDVVEQIMWDKVKSTIQTKITDFFL